MTLYAAPCPTGPTRERLPCSQSQKSFRFESQLQPGNPGPNVAVRWRLEGAWQLIVDRHQTLRSAFETVRANHKGLPIAAKSLFTLRTLGVITRAIEASSEREHAS